MRIARQGEHGRTLGAKCALVDGKIRIAFRAHQFAVFEMGDDVAIHRTKRADTDNFFGSFDFEVGGISPQWP